MAGGEHVRAAGADSSLKESEVILADLCFVP